MEPLTTITISLPTEISKEMQQVALEEQRTVSELLRETFRQYQALKSFKELCEEGQALTKKKKLTPEDFGGPFEE